MREFQDVLEITAPEYGQEVAINRYNLGKLKIRLPHLNRAEWSRVTQYQRWNVESRSSLLLLLDYHDLLSDQYSWASLSAMELAGIMTRVGDVLEREREPRCHILWHFFQGKQGSKERSPEKVLKNLVYQLAVSSRRPMCAEAFEACKSVFRCDDWVAGDIESITNAFLGVLDIVGRGTRIGIVLDRIDLCDDSRTLMIQMLKIIASSRDEHVVKIMVVAHEKTWDVKDPENLPTAISGFREGDLETISLFHNGKAEMI